MKLINVPDFYQTCKKALQRQSTFGLWISPGFLGIRKGLLCKDIFDPLIPYTQRVLIFDLNLEHKKVKLFKNYLAQEGAYHLLDMAGKKWDHYLPLLYGNRLFSGIDIIRGAIVIQCAHQDVPWKDIFKFCYGPVINNQQNGTCLKKALDFAKSHFDDEHVFVLIDTINTGLESITITGNQDILGNLFDAAAETCDITKHMLGVF